jgi:phosphate transport system substrate-binding protein
LQGEIAPEAAPGARWVADDAAVSRAVVADLRGVGVVDLTAIGGARALPVAETGAAPVSPIDHAAVAANGYPLAYRLYLYSSPRTSSVFAQRFAAYALSPEGQAVVEEHGLVSPTLRAGVAASAGQSGRINQGAVPAGGATQGAVQVGGAAAGGAVDGAAAGGAVQAAVPAGETGRLRAYVAGAKKLGVVFHFQANSASLDQYGERDLDRVANYLVSMHEGGDHLLLAGFTDNLGDAGSNVEVSRERAQSVAALFATRGLKPGGVEGFGAAVPLADNGTEIGRERNRRVEVYIRR